jgi:hypothetical protein
MASSTRTWHQLQTKPRPSKWCEVRRFDRVGSGRVPWTLGAHASAGALRVPSNLVLHTTQSQSK